MKLARTAAVATICTLLLLPTATAQQASGTSLTYLSEEGYERLFERWRSATKFIEGTAIEGNLVYGANSEAIGEIKDIVFGPQGKALSVIAEVGGLWDIGDTHVSIPWSEIVLNDPSDGLFGILAPITEETVDDFGLFGSDSTTGVDTLEEGVVVAAPAWRATEVIGDLVRLENDGDFASLGYVYDLFFSDDGVIAVVVIRPDVSLDLRGLFAVPFGDGEWLSASDRRFHDLPYTFEDVRRASREPADDMVLE